MMARSYSKEFRREVLSACDEGVGTREVATRFKVSESWVRRIKQERRELGKTAPCLTRNRIPEWAVYSDQILAIYDAQPDTTLKELKAKLGTKLSTKTLCIACQKLNLTFKKKSWSHQSKNAEMSR
jgi:transposase